MANSSKTKIAKSSNRHKDAKKARKVALGLKKGTIQKLCRLAGVKRIGESVYAMIQRREHAFLDQVIAKSLLYTTNRNCTTISIGDITNGLKVSGVQLYTDGDSMDKKYSAPSKKNKKEVAGK